MSSETETPSFAVLLRRYRQAAGLTQEALAERARLSVGAISSLERGLKHAPRKDTIALLVEALALSTEEARSLEATIHRVPGSAVHRAPVCPALP